MLTIDDFVMLGKTVPEPNSDGRTFVCSAGFSAQLRSLLRIYPLSRFQAPPRWSVCTARLERNPKDSRAESWKLYGDRTPDGHDRINVEAFEVGRNLPEGQRAHLLNPFAVESIADANERRLSLAVVHPNGMDLEFEHNPQSPDSPQLALFDAPGEPPAGAKRFPFIPRLRFKDQAGEHLLMLRDWGVYERMRKADGFDTWSDGARRRHITEALHLDSTCSLLIGNFNRHRSAWLVISVLRGVRSAASLFDDLDEAA